MRPYVFLRNALAGFGVIVIAAGLAVAVFRKSLAETLTRNVLRDAGITINGLTWEKLGGRENVLTGLDAVMAGQKVSIDRISIERASLVPPSIKQVTISGAHVHLNPADLASVVKHTEGERTEVVSEPATLPPLAGLSADVHFTMGKSDPTPLADVSFSLTTVGEQAIKATTAINGEASTLQGSGEYDLRSGTASFSIPESKINLGEVERRLNDFLPGLLQGFSLGGNSKLTAGGTLTSGVWKAWATLTFDNATAKNAEKKIEILGIRGTLSAPDALAMTAQSEGLITTDSATFGNIVTQRTEITDLRVSENQIQAVNFATHIFGGTLSLADLKFNLESLTGQAVIRFSHLDITELAKLFPGIGAEIVGQADGEIPLIYDKAGLKFGRGWIALAPNTLATLKLDHPGLITGGMSKGGAAYSLLSKVENGILFLRVTGLRGEIYPNVEEGVRSVTFKIEGQPMDPEVKAPVALSVNINGPVVRLINWGMSDQVSFQTK